MNLDAPNEASTDKLILVTPTGSLNKLPEWSLKSQNNVNNRASSPV